MFDGMGEQTVEGLALGAGERGERLVVDLLKSAVQVPEELAAARGESDDRAATVGSVSTPLDQAGIFEAVEDRDEIRGIDAEQFGERLLRGGSAFAEVLKRVQLTRA